MVFILEHSRADNRKDAFTLIFIYDLIFKPNQQRKREIFLIELNAKTIFCLNFQPFFPLINNLIKYSAQSKLATFGVLGNNL